ncbi:hypothetical protein E6H27_06220 [Candidatus Bathyarchaeota archaeon]|nr:MAG: hypothetical protein E6H27_06220 [Candidatus Bathyarchaeota archaeon]TMI58171.1 MAG: hypothetical protein E6H14_05820 [Candidatus Bathyarchaeota archaeon]
MKAVYARGAKFVPVALGINFGSREVLMGRYGCFNCNSNTGDFAFLVIALGFVAFGVYAAKQRRQSSRPEEDHQDDEQVIMDEEGWETKSFDSKEPSTKASGKDEGWETKPEG